VGLVGILVPGFCSGSRRDPAALPVILFRRWLRPRTRLARLPGRRPMRIANTAMVAVILTSLATLTVTGASAMAYRFACQGRLDEQRILFDLQMLYIAIGNGPVGKPGKFSKQSIEEAIASVKNGRGFTQFNADDNSGFITVDGPLTFAITEDGKQKQKVVLTEQSSKRISHRSRVICGRGEDTDLYQKVFRYQLNDEPTRDIIMQCMEYNLSTPFDRKSKSFLRCRSPEYW
jgi:hypothetical protein